MDKNAIEQDKYVSAYTLPGYKMGPARKASAFKCIDHILKSDSTISTHLDVSAGRGETVKYIKSKGIQSIGTEIVPELLNSDVVFGWSHDLPFENKSIDFITNLDAMEHYLPEQTNDILDELVRIAKKYIYFTISNNPSHLPDGRDLHINIKTYPEWKEKLEEYGTVDWMNPHENRISESFLLSIQ